MKKILFLLTTMLSASLIGGTLAANTGMNPLECITGAFLVICSLGFITMPAGVLFSVPAFCFKIAADITPNCIDPITRGVNDKLWLINHSDITSITYNNTNPLIVEAITLASGAKAYVYQGERASVSPKAEGKSVKHGFEYTHTVEALLFDLSPTTKAEVAKLCRGRLVAVCLNSYKGTGGNAALEIYGLESGLLCLKVEKDPRNKDSLGAISFTLATDAEDSESSLAKPLFITDFATSLAVITSLQD